VRILAVTWNLAGKTPQPVDLANLLHPAQIHHDIYVIGTQEALGSIMGAMFSPSKDLMNQMIQTCLGDEYVMVSSVCLQATHLVVFVRKRLSPLISNIVTDTCATGFK